MDWSVRVLDWGVRVLVIEPLNLMHAQNTNRDKCESVLALACNMLREVVSILTRYLDRRPIPNDVLEAQIISVTERLLSTSQFMIVS